MQIQKREILRAIAEIAYVIAKADRGLSSEERIAFNRIIEKELDYESWVAQSRFELLDEITHPTIEKAYNEAIRDLRKYKAQFTPELKEKALRVFQQVADACSGFSEREAFIIDRFKSDLHDM
jgi:tellurite resistance protein